MNRLELLLIRMRRLRHSRGFGIHSPSAYRFACEVINRRRAGRECRELRRGRPVVVRKLGELYLRVGRHAECDMWIDRPGRSDVYEAYVRLIGKQVRFARAGEHFEWPAGGVGEHVVVRTTTDEKAEAFYEEVVARAGEHWILIIEPGEGRKAFRRLWQKVLADERTGVTFDLYHCGIVFFDSRRPKQNHIVNF